MIVSRWVMTTPARSELFMTTYLRRDAEAIDF